MASPQAEEGHTDIANETMEALAGIRISGEEWQCLLVILRKTYGWHKKEDSISLSQFVLKTKMKKPSVSRALKKLLTKKLIHINKKANGQPNIYRFNKNFDQWEPLTKKQPPLTKMLKGVNKNDNQRLQKCYPQKKLLTKETSLKENIKTNKKETSFSPDDLAKLWNQYVCVDDIFPTATIPLSKGRASKAKSRIKERSEPTYWIDLFKKIKTVPWCRGEAGRNWVADFSYIIKNDSNHIKIFEYNLFQKNTQEPDAIDAGLQELADKGEL